MQIKNIQLRSQNLESQKTFYVDRLGFELLKDSENKFSISCGKTQITFERSSKKNYYHFAFNIPSFQIKEAFDYLESKSVEFIPYQGSFFIDFKSWNAEAVYFYDADRNLVEFIARKNMEIKSSHNFSIKSILGLSEIGMPVLNVKSVYQQLVNKLEMEQYSGDQSYFCAMGDEEGLFIIVDQNKKNWMPTDLPAIPVPFKMEILENDKNYDFEFDGKGIKIKSKTLS